MEYEFNLSSWHPFSQTRRDRREHPPLPSFRGRAKKCGKNRGIHAHCVISTAVMQEQEQKVLTCAVVGGGPVCYGTWCKFLIEWFLDSFPFLISSTNILTIVLILAGWRAASHLPRNTRAQRASVRVSDRYELDAISPIFNVICLDWDFSRCIATFLALVDVCRCLPCFIR